MMRLPRPASPRALWQDLRAVLSARSPHQWLAAALALAIPLTVGTAFYFDTIDAHDPGEQIIYVNSWPLNRTDAEIVAKQTADEQRRQEWEAERQRSFQRLDNSLTNLGI